MNKNEIELEEKLFSEKSASSVGRNGILKKNLAKLANGGCE